MCSEKFHGSLLLNKTVFNLRILFYSKTRSLQRYNQLKTSKKATEKVEKLFHLPLFFVKFRGFEKCLFSHALDSFTSSRTCGEFLNDIEKSTKSTKYPTLQNGSKLN